MSIFILYKISLLTNFHFLIYKGMSNLDLKFVELQTLYSLVEVQVTTLDQHVKSTEDEDVVKFLKSELTKMKSLKTKLSKIIKDY